MPKEEWGVKRVCPKCATRFYDLQNDPMTCPSCAAVFDVESLTQQKSRTVAPEKVEKEKETPETDSQTADDDLLDTDDDLGDADLGDDVLDEEDDDTVNLDDIADMPSEDDES